MPISQHDVICKFASAKVLFTLTGECEGHTVEVTLRFVGEIPAVAGLWGSFLSTGSRQAVEGEIVAKWALAKTPVSVMVAVEGKRLECKTQISERRKHLWLTDRLMIDGVQIADPATVTEVDQRSDTRYRTSDSAGGIYGKLMSGGKEVAGGSLWDISGGGASFLVPMDRDLLQMPRGRWFDCQIIFRGRKIVLRGQLAHAKAFSTRTLRVGLKFAKGAGEAAPGMVEALGDAIRQLEMQKAAA